MIGKTIAHYQSILALVPAEWVKSIWRATRGSAETLR